jgi:hypothetical protein
LEAGQIFLAEEEADLFMLDSLEVSWEIAEALERLFLWELIPFNEMPV